MTIPLQVTFKDFPPSTAVEQRIRERVDRLERFHKRIIECRVVVEAPHRRHVKGKLYHLNIVILIPGGEVVVNNESHDKQAHEDIYVAIRDAFGAAERQLEDHVRVKGGKVKAHEAPRHGNISKMFPDYGFIEDSEGVEIYFHRNSVVDAEYEKLEVGDEVRIVVAESESDKGPQASTVKPIGKHHIVD
jgi:ribosomal subunit interface protein